MPDGKADIGISEGIRVQYVLPYRRERRREERDITEVNVGRRAGFYGDKYVRFRHRRTDDPSCHPRWRKGEDAGLRVGEW